MLELTPSRQGQWRGIEPGDGDGDGDGKIGKESGEVLELEKIWSLINH